MKSLDEAIMHCEEVAEKQEEWCERFPSDKKAVDCATEHRQLAEWLRELKAYRESWEYLFATIYVINSNAENEDIKNITNFLLKYMRIYENEIGEVKADDSM